MTPGSNETVTLGGRQFKSVSSSTIEHDLWVMARIRAAGLDQVMLEHGEQPDDFVLRLLREAVMNADVFMLLGGLMVPVDLKPEQWTPEVAEQTANHIRLLTDPADKQIVQTCVVTMLLYFFENGLASLMTSPNSLKPPMRNNEPESAIAVH